VKETIMTAFEILATQPKPVRRDTALNVWRAWYASEYPRPDGSVCVTKAGV
jgi:hypothetical protein